MKSVQGFLTLKWGVQTMCWTDDPIADFNRYDRELEKKEAKLPKCSDCGEPIYDEYYYKINGKIICIECIEDYREDVDIDDE